MPQHTTTPATISDDEANFWRNAAARAMQTATGKLTNAHGGPVDDATRAAFRDIAWNCSPTTVDAVTAILAARPARPVTTNGDVETAARTLAAADGKTWQSLTGAERSGYGDRVRAALPAGEPETLADYMRRTAVDETDGLPINAAWIPSPGAVLVNGRWSDEPISLPYA